MSPCSLSTNDNWEIEAIIKTTGEFNPITIWQTNTIHLGFFGYNDIMRVYDYGSSKWLTSELPVPNEQNNWIKVIIKLVDGTIYYDRYDLNDNLLGSQTFELPSTYQNKTVNPCFSGFQNNSTNRNSNYLKLFKIQNGLKT